MVTNVIFRLTLIFSLENGHIAHQRKYGHVTVVIHKRTARVIPANKFGNKCYFLVKHFFYWKRMQYLIMEKRLRYNFAHVRIIRATHINCFYNFECGICQIFIKTNFCNNINKNSFLNSFSFL